MFLLFAIFGFVISLSGVYWLCLQDKLEKKSPLLLMGMLSAASVLAVLFLAREIR